MVGWGKERINYMYNYVEDKVFLKKAQNICSSILNDLTSELLKHDISSQFFLVGSGARNMVTQNNEEPIDFDYNLYIQKTVNIKDEKELKETVRKVFNIVLKKHGWADCQDSTSSLTTEKRHFKVGNQTEFSIDVCIVAKGSNDSWYRLIHQKTGYTYTDKYFWNEAPHSKDIKAKVDKIKDVGYWQLVRNEYLKIKNLYLSRNDHDHPSFICYIEAVNNIYNTLSNKRLL
jgi:hypothetical protein